MTVSLVAFASATPSFVTQASAASCVASAEADFNGDGLCDLAVADPEATVAAAVKAGAVNVVYGGGKGAVSISQATTDVPSNPEAGDGFGSALAVVDWNSDGYSDLMVGVPFEAVGSERQAGCVDVIFGSADGLAGGPLSKVLYQGAGGGALSNSTAEARDWFGYSLASGLTSGSEPYLLIGVPGEDLSGIPDAGGVHYVRPTYNEAVNQDSAGVVGAPEENDRFGFSVAASAKRIAVGVPGEAIGTETFSGAVELFDNPASGVPPYLAWVDQSTDGINGSAETGDRLGASVAMVDDETDSLVAIGVPGEDTSTGEDAGRVVTVSYDSAGLRQVADIHQSVAGVTGIGEDGDYFGQQVTAVNTSPGAPGQSTTLLLAVGIPGEDIGEIEDAGSVEVFSLLGAPGDHDVVVEPTGILPGEHLEQEFLGTSVWASASALYVGMPYGTPDEGEVYAVPWANVVEGAADPVTTWKPGSDGIATGSIAFGAVVR